MSGFTVPADEDHQLDMQEARENGPEGPPPDWPEPADKSTDCVYCHTAQGQGMKGCTKHFEVLTEEEFVAKLTAENAADLVETMSPLSEVSDMLTFEADDPSRPFKTDRDTARDEVERIVNERVTYPGEEHNESPVIPITQNMEHLYLILGWVDHYLAAAKHLQKEIESEIAAKLGAGGGVRMGDELLRYSNPPDRVLIDGGKEWVASLSTEDALAVLPGMRDFRIKGMKAVAEKLGLSLDALEGSLYYDRSKDKGPKLTRIPVDNENAPKYAAKMEPGELRIPKPRKEPTT